MEFGGVNKVRYHFCFPFLTNPIKQRDKSRFGRHDIITIRLHCSCIALQISCNVVELPADFKVAGFYISKRNGRLR